jgi:hypothetical protein
VEGAEAAGVPTARGWATDGLHWAPASRTHCPRRGATTLDTEILTDECKLQLDSVLNMGTRSIAGFVLSEHHDSKVAYGKLPMAVAVAVRGGALPGVTLHTDR